MLSIQNVYKKYTTGTLVQTALDGVSLNLRDNEFVAILGPSGSGKTTLLNVIGGLDRYDSGDLVINGISTKKYRDRDWDSYRNHAIGFVFQSYNLIPHQSVLANVELALTISGISKSERRRRATEALEEVGLGDQLHKKPAQMSGGQMQRVAIARALVNDPEILLADEPTGALDTDTGLQVMELLKKVAEKRLVVMVTHNPELAETYANRIVKLKDGKIIGDTNPYEINDETPAEHKNLGKASMSFLTALTLSFNNLRTKKGRTFLTAFAGSIGIIGIALILSLSTGVNTYIDNIQRDTMSSYPIQIDAQTVDLSSMMQSSGIDAMSSDFEHDNDAVYSNPAALQMVSGLMSSFTENNLTAFKAYLESDECDMDKYLGDDGIVYSYSTKYTIWAKDENGRYINTDGSTLNPKTSQAMSMMPEQTAAMMTKVTNFQELIPGKGDALVSSTITDLYEVVEGSWPSAYDEVVLVLNRNNEVDANVLYNLGFGDSNEYIKVIDKLNAGEKIDIEQERFEFSEVLGKEFILVSACDTYKDNGNSTFTKINEDLSSPEYIKLLEDESRTTRLKIVGVVRPKEDTKVMLLVSPIAYTSALSKTLMEHANNSPIVTAQLANDGINVLSGREFRVVSETMMREEADLWFSYLGVNEKSQLFLQINAQSGTSDESVAAMNDEMRAIAFDQMLSANPSLKYMIYEAMNPIGTYKENLANFGYADPDAPSSISIYAKNFEDKEKIVNFIADYNETVTEENKITYTDYVGILMSSVTTIIDVISYVLIAFVSVSLVVSSIMIGIITYISVLERTKEIGILRAIGASKRNVSQVFNAETFIVGLASGIIGITVTILLIIPINAVIHSLSGINDINAILPWKGAIFLVILSMILTVISGLIPAKKAAKKDPVAALRSE